MDQASAARPGSLSLVGGDIALDFANTVSGRGGPAELDHLRGPEDVAAWARHAEAGAIGDAWRPPADLHGKAVELREAVIHVGDALARRAPPPIDAAQRLLACHAEHLAKAEPAFEAGRLRLVYPPAAGASAILGPIAAAAVALLSDKDTARLKKCPAPDCGWLFYDATKNASRRWCDMQVCGARSKVAAFRSRRRGMRCEGL